MYLTWAIVSSYSFLCLKYKKKVGNQKLAKCWNLSRPFEISLAHFLHFGRNFCVVLDQKKYKHKSKSFDQEKQMVHIFVEALRSAEER